MILDEIVEYTKYRVNSEKQEISIHTYEELAKKIGSRAKAVEQNSFYRNLKTAGLSFICEVKKASPSKGIIAETFDYRHIAKEYEKAGAAAISVLTEPKFFMGKNEYLEEISKCVELPLLRKDFVVDEYQIYQAKVIGASAVLLICSVLSKDQLKEYLGLTHELGLAALVEVHNENEIEMALSCNAKIVGVNNRNLKNFTVDINTSIKLRKEVPKDVVFVAESGMRTPEDIRALYEASVDGVLIGETMMRSQDKFGMMNYLTSLIPK